MKSDTSKIKRLIQLITRIGIATGHKNMSLNALNVLFTAALADFQGEPMDSGEITKITGLSKAGVGHILGMLGRYSRGKTPSLRLLKMNPDLTDRRYKLVRLTPKGRKAIKLILKEI